MDEEAGEDDGTDELTPPTTGYSCRDWTRQGSC